MFSHFFKLPFCRLFIPEVSVNALYFAIQINILDIGLSFTELMTEAF